MSDSNNCHLIIPLLPQLTKEGNFDIKNNKHRLLFHFYYNIRCSGTTLSPWWACWGPALTGLWAPPLWRCVWLTAPGWITRWTGILYFVGKCALCNFVMLIVSQELYLYPWDAGVDSGISYESPDQQTFPNQPIKVKQFYNYVHIFNHCFLLLEFVFKYISPWSWSKIALSFLSNILSHLLNILSW